MNYLKKCIIAQLLTQPQQVVLNYPSADVTRKIKKVAESVALEVESVPQEEIITSTLVEEMTEDRRKYRRKEE